MSRQGFGKYGLDHPTWQRAECFFYATAEEAQAGIEKTYGTESGHIVVGPVLQDGDS